MYARYVAHCSWPTPLLYIPLLDPASSAHFTTSLQTIDGYLKDRTFTMCVSDQTKETGLGVEKREGLGVRKGDSLSTSPSLTVVVKVPNNVGIQDAITCHLD